MARCLTARGARGSTFAAPKHRGEGRDPSIYKGKQVSVGTKLGEVEFHGKRPHVRLSVHARESSNLPTTGLKPGRGLGSEPLDGQRS